MTNESKEWIKPTILELREWGCNKLADLLAEELEKGHTYFIQAISQTSENTVLYGCADCGLEFEEVIEE